jgi:O-antigen/teichoic acid export membrane protein
VNSLLVICAGILQRILPLLLGIVVANFYGLQSLTQITFFIVVINTLSIFVSAGLGPALLTTLPSFKGEMRAENDVIRSFLIFVFAMLLLVGCIIFPLFGVKYGVLSAVAYFLGGMGLVFFGVVIAAFQALGHYLKAAVCAATFFVLIVMIVAVFVFSGADFSGFLLWIGGAYLFSGLGLLVYLLVVRKISLVGGVDLSKVAGVVVTAGPIFIFNALWMVSVFVLNSQLIEDVSVQEYGAFSLGYQWFSVLVFIPGILAGVFIPHLKQMSSLEGAMALALRLSVYYFAFALVVFLAMFAAFPIFEYVYGTEILANGKRLFYLVLGVGVLGCALAPLIQFNVSYGSGWELVIAAVLWSVIVLSIYYGGRTTAFAVTGLFSAYFIVYLYFIALGRCQRVVCK